MSNQTVHKTPQRTTRSRAAARGGNFRKQTARLEGRRDGAPVIFGWGAHLTRTQKSQMQRLIALGFLGLVIVAILATIGFGILQQNVIIPNQTIVTVDGVNITQDAYRKELAYGSQNVWNSLQLAIKQHNDLQTKIQQGDAQAQTEDQIVITQIQSYEGNYSQSVITANTMQVMVEDVLIKKAAADFEKSKNLPASTFEPSAKAINDALAAFKKEFPANESYASFLSKDNLTEADVKTGIAMQIRRQLMQTYFSAQVVSPVQQAHLRQIQTGNLNDAKKALAAIQKSGDWNAVAKQDSNDTDTKDKGGDMGFVAPWTGDAVVEAWAFAPGRKVNDITSDPILGTDGTYHVVQLLGYEKRDVDASTLSAAKDNALSHWLDGQKSALGKKITTPDSTMLTAARNLPKTPDLNATLPNFSNGSSIGGATTGG